MASVSIFSDIISLLTSFFREMTGAATASSAADSVTSNIYLFRNIKYPWVIFLFLLIAIVVFVLLQMNFMRFKSDEEKKLYICQRRWMRIFVGVSRFIVLILLAFAIATPFIHEEKVVEGDLSITILADNSTSFDLFNKSTAQSLKEKLDLRFPANLRYIAFGNVSDIAGGILNSLKGNDNLLLVTDGQSNYGKNLRDMMMFASQLNSTINMLDIDPMMSDTSITIEGLDKSIRGTDAPFMAVVRQAGASVPYHITVKIGQEVMVDEDAAGSRNFVFSKRLAEGYHKITGELAMEGDDYWADNNKFYKTIEVLPRPKMFMWADKESAFYKYMIDLYNFERQDTLPASLDPYVAVIMDDINMNKISQADFDRLNDFVLNGSGLVVIGGQDSYNNGGYQNSLLETMLPVKVNPSEKDPIKDENVNIVIVMDISDSTGGLFGMGSRDLKVDVQKAQALAMLDYIKPTSKVGFIVFNTQAYVVSPLEPLKDKSGFRETIASLNKGGGTEIGEGIAAATMMLNGVKGSNNIILISDGVTISPEYALAMTERAKRVGIKTYTVGVGQDTYEFLMKSIAYTGGGSYYQPTQSQRLKIIFGEPDDNEENCTADRRKVIAIDETHFITMGIDLNAFISGYNFVTPKPSALPLVVTCNGKPVITVWRYGLGRVASMSTDDGTKWAGDMLSATNSEVLTRTINWAIGDPNRKKDLDVDVHDTTLGKPVKVKVRSKEQPVSDIINFSKVDVDHYEGDFNPKETGFYTLFDADVGVSYNDELQRIGMNSELYDIVRATKGEVFKPDDITGMINKTKSVMRRTETTEKFIRWPFIGLALCLLLLEILIRRVWESRIL